MVIEQASVHDRSDGGIAASLRHAPRWAIDRINAARQRAGMPAIAVEPTQAARDGGGRVSVYWDPASPHRPRGAGLQVSAPRHGGRGPLVTRVLLAACYGDASARDVRRDVPETISRNAFGPASTLNAEIGWGVTAPGHDGPIIQFGGPTSQGRLRAIDTEVGLMLSWLPDLSDARHKAALEMIERGAGCSVNMRVKERQRLPGPIEMVTRARLINVAITDRPCYRGAAAMIFRDSFRDDDRQLREQIAKVAAEARFRDRRGRGLVC